MPDPELIAEYKALELEAQKDPKAASTPEMKESLEKARSELESRIRTREETLQSEAKMRQLEQHINHLMVSELAEDIASKERFYQRWNLQAEEAIALGFDLDEPNKARPTDPEAAAQSYNLDIDGKNETLNHLSILNDLMQLDPLFMKNHSHLTPEERHLSNAYSRQIEKRIAGITERLNYFEILRNRSLFQ